MVLPREEIGWLTSLLKLDELQSWLAFADQNLIEVADLRQLLDGTGGNDALNVNQAAAASCNTSKRMQNGTVKSCLASATAYAGCEGFLSSTGRRASERLFGRSSWRSSI